MHSAGYHQTACLEQHQVEQPAADSRHDANERAAYGAQMAPPQNSTAMSATAAQPNTRLLRRSRKSPTRSANTTCPSTPRIAKVKAQSEALPAPIFTAPANRPDGLTVPVAARRPRHLPAPPVQPAPGARRECLDRHQTAAGKAAVWRRSRQRPAHGQVLLPQLDIVSSQEPLAQLRGSGPAQTRSLHPLQRSSVPLRGAGVSLAGEPPALWGWSNYSLTRFQTWIVCPVSPWW